MSICLLDGCDKKSPKNQYCNTHYMQVRRRGYASLNTRLSPNKITYMGEYLLIGLTDNKGYITSEAMIDSEDLELIKGYKWYQKPNGYVSGIKNGKRKYLHRLVMNCPDNMVINHWDHNTLNCRKSNLKICTQSDNALYKRKHKGKYPYKGVEYRTDCKKRWSATGTFYGTRIRMGRFDTIEEAAYVYDQFAIQIGGEYAITNFDYNLL